MEIVMCNLECGYNLSAYKEEKCDVLILSFVI